jgi:membrane-bound lytic murein transglycosylase B
LVVLVAGAASGSDGDRNSVRASSTTAPAPSVLPAQPPADLSQLAADIDRAQQIIDDPSSTTALLASAGGFDQLATGDLAHKPWQTQQTVVAMLSKPAAASMRASLAAATSLARLVTRHKRLPPWRIVQPPAPPTLLGYFKLAEARFGIRWEYLAAIEFIETKFGRVQGTSTAGAQGPMQFLPATWASYGSGNIDNPRDAILGAARYLRANGAPHDIAGALYHYNPSGDYVAAVDDYARTMRADPRAYYGYYNWQVLFAYARGPVILPVGYPKVRPIAVRYPG